MRTRSIINLCCAAMCAIATTSCFNNDYDLNNIDMTIGSEVDLTLPNNSTGNITLASFIMDNKNDYLDTVDLGDGKAKVLYLAVKGAANFNFNGIKPGALTPVGGNPQFDIKIENVPDILKGENTYLDLKNPIVTVFSYSQPQNTIKTDVGLTAYASDQSSISTIVNNLQFENGNTLHYIREAGETEATAGTVPADVLKKIDKDYATKYKHTTDANVAPDANTLSSLFAQIPEKIHVELKNIVATGTQVTAETQNVNQTYQLYAPLHIGNQFNLDYKTDASGWISSFDDIKELSDTNAVVTIIGEIDNNTPLDAEITVTPKGTDGKPLTAYIKAFTQKGILAGKSGNAISYTLQSQDKRYNITDYMTGRNGAPRLDGIDIDCILTNSTQNITDSYLRTDAAVILKNVKVHVKGTIIYNAN